MTSAPTIRVVVAAPHAPAEVRAIPNTLEAMQAIVGGYIEELPRWANIGAGIVYANEEGRPQGLQPNREGPKGSELLGTIVVVKPGPDGDLASLTDGEAAEIVAALEKCKTGN